MIRSMSSALSGLRNHQVMLDVVGNNIANVSSIGFKGSSTLFADVLTQTLNGAGAPSEQSGGTNPAQVGLGSRLAGTVQSFTQGALQRTGRTTDLAIQGDGFFVVKAGNEQLYTRAGSFMLDAEGNVTTPDGMLVQGWGADAAGTIDTNGVIGPMKIRVGDSLPPVQTTAIDLGGNLSADAAAGDVQTLAVTTYDDQGTPILLNVTFTKGATANQWAATAETADGTAVAFSPAANLTFDANGELTAPASFELTIPSASMATMSNDITIRLGAAGQPGRLTQYAGSASAAITNQNGSATGSLQSFSVAQDGTIVGSFSNGRTRNIGRVAMAVFTNPGGLERIGGTWRETANSGLAQVGTAGGGGRGMLSSGTLEMSNVDLAEEFTRLIVSQRGFQGNARVISTADEILQEVVNLGR